MKISSGAAILAVILGAGLGAGLGASGGARAADDPPAVAAPAKPADPYAIPPGRYTLFISPSGKPYRGDLKDPYPVAVWFAAANTSHDGKLTRAQFRADAEAFFHELDTNRDGIIDPDELRFYEKVVAPEIVVGFSPDQDQGPAVQRGASADQGRRTGDPDLNASGDTGYVVTQGEADAFKAPPETPPQGAAWFSFMGEPEPVAAADESFDGRITLKEFLHTANERFSLLDPDNHGFVTLDQLPLTPVAARAPKPKRGKK